jgi:hypothetical protein
VIYYRLESEGVKRKKGMDRPERQARMHDSPARRGEQLRTREGSGQRSIVQVQDRIDGKSLGIEATFHIHRIAAKD